ncbi:aryl-sulfate sulfotransferase [Pseudomonadota bacterium]|nr:aryl-sulfate sulfotransferase [Pseudomonadota bacterium]
MKIQINRVFYNFIILLFLMSCSNNSGLSNDEKITIYKTSLNTFFDDDNLIVSINSANDLLNVQFEDGNSVSLEKKLVSVENNFWNKKFNFIDGSSLSIGSINDDLNIDFEVSNFALPLSKNFEIEIPFNGFINWVTYGRNGESSNINSHDIPVSPGINNFLVHGLYVDGITEVSIFYKNSKNNIRYSKKFNLNSTEFSETIDSINIITTVNSQPEVQRFVLFCHRSGSGPFVVDQFGDFRYYLNVKPSDIGNPFYGLKQTSDKTLIWSETNKIYEYDINGNPITEHNIPEKYGRIHHDILKLEDQKYLLTVNNNELTTIEDIIILYDVSSQDVIKEWDLNISVPKSDYFIGSDGFTDTWNDWFHTNAIEYVDFDQSLLISGQRSGVVKISWDNELIWFLTDKKRFLNESAEIRNKILFNTYDEIITWGQHNIKYDSVNNDYYLFDNGLGRNYEHLDLFSRGVKFDVNEDDFTYEILDTYGEDYPEYHSPIISGIDFLENGNVLNLFGSIGYELTYTNNKDWLGRIWKNPQPDYGAAIQEYDINGNLILEFQISSVVSNESHRFYNRDPGIYRASYFNF